MEKEANDTNIITMVDRAFQIIETIYKSEKSVGVSYLAEQLKLPKATVFRILNTMSVWGYAEQENESEKYKLGSSFIKIGENVRRSIDVVSISKPFMSKLAEDFGETVYLCKLYNDEALIVETTVGEGCALYSMVDPIIPLYCSALGRIFLLEYSEDDIKRYLEKTTLEPRTVNTINTKEKLIEEIVKIKQNEIAFDYEEYEYGMTCIAGPIYNNQNKIIASLSVSGPTTRIKYKGVDEVTEKISSICKSISEKMKY